MRTSNSVLHFLACVGQSLRMQVLSERIHSKFVPTAGSLQASSQSMSNNGRRISKTFRAILVLLLCFSSPVAGWQIGGHSQSIAMINPTMRLCRSHVGRLPAVQQRLRCGTSSLVRLLMLVQDKPSAQMQKARSKELDEAISGKDSSHDCHPERGIPVNSSVGFSGAAGRPPQRKSDVSMTTLGQVEIGTPDYLLDEGYGREELTDRLETAIQSYARACVSQEAFTSCFLGGAADLVVQAASHGSFENIDYARVLSFMAFGTFYAGSFQPWVYRSFDRLFGDDVPRKLLAEFFAYAPLLYVPSFYIITGLFQGLGWSGSMDKLNDKYVATLLSFFAVWPAPMFAYFKWVPENQRVLFLAICGFIEKIAYSIIGQSN